MITYDRIETSARVPANNRIYLGRDERTNHERLRVQARIGAIVAAPKPAGVEALRQALEAAGVDALVSRDEGPVATRDVRPSYQTKWGYFDEVDRSGYDNTWKAFYAGLIKPIRPATPFLSKVGVS